MTVQYNKEFSIEVSSTLTTSRNENCYKMEKCTIYSKGSNLTMNSKFESYLKRNCELDFTIKMKIYTTSRLQILTEKELQAQI